VLDMWRQPEGGGGCVKSWKSMWRHMRTSRKPVNWVKWLLSSYKYESELKIYWISNQGSSPFFQVQRRLESHRNILINGALILVNKSPLDSIFVHKKSRRKCLPRWWDESFATAREWEEIKFPGRGNIPDVKFMALPSFTTVKSNGILVWKKLSLVLRRNRLAPMSSYPIHFCLSVNKNVLDFDKDYKVTAE
jgi:hypothetical protein